MKTHKIIIVLWFLSVAACGWQERVGNIAISETHLSVASGSLLIPEGKGDQTDSEWHQWRGPRRDGVSRETGLLTHWPEEGLPVLWKVPGGDGFSSLAISEERVYTLVDRDNTEWVLCLDADTGKELWKVRSDEPYSEYQGGNGPRATPTVDGSRVYTLGANGALLCLNKETGEVLWRRNILSDFGADNLHWGTSTSPLVEDEMLLVNVGAPSASVVAFDKHTGDVLWKSLDDIAGYSSPIAITVDGVRDIVFFCGKAILGVSPKDGKLHWRQEWKTLSDMNIATPIFSDPFLFVASGRGTGSGVLRLSREGDGVQAEVVWTAPIMQNHFNSCVLLGDYVYGFDNTVLKCIRLKDGSVMWADRSVGKGSLIYAQGHLFIMGERGVIGVAEATPDAYREHGRMEVLAYKSWTPPALSGGRLYIRDQQHIACLDASAKSR